MGDLVDFAVWRAGLRAPRKAAAEETSGMSPFGDRHDVMLIAIGALLRIKALDDDERWRLIGALMESIKDRR